MENKTALSNKGSIRNSTIHKIRQRDHALCNGRADLFGSEMRFVLTISEEKKKVVLGRFESVRQAALFAVSGFVCHGDSTSFENVRGSSSRFFRMTHEQFKNLIDTGRLELTNRNEPVIVEIVDTSMEQPGGKGSPRLERQLTKEG